MLPGRLFDPFRVGWLVAGTVPWAAFASGELAHGYYLQAFQAGGRQRRKNEPAPSLSAVRSV